MNMCLSVWVRVCLHEGVCWVSVFVIRVLLYKPEAAAPAPPEFSPGEGCLRDALPGPALSLPFGQCLAGKRAGWNPVFPAVLFPREGSRVTGTFQRKGMASDRAVLGRSQCHQTQLHSSPLLSPKGFLPRQPFLWGSPGIPRPPLSAQLCHLTLHEPVPGAGRWTELAGPADAMPLLVFVVPPPPKRRGEGGRGKAGAGGGGGGVGRGSLCVLCSRA